MNAGSHRYSAFCFFLFHLSSFSNKMILSRDYTKEKELMGCNNCDTVKYRAWVYLFYIQLLFVRFQEISSYKNEVYYKSNQCNYLFFSKIMFVLWWLKWFQLRNTNIKFCLFRNETSGFRINHVFFFFSPLSLEMSAWAWLFCRGEEQNENVGEWNREKNKLFWIWIGELKRK